MKKFILIIIYSFFFVLILFPFLNINNLYLWLIDKPKIVQKIKIESFYLIFWNTTIAKKVVDFRIKHSFFPYENEFEMNYDLYMTSNKYSFNKMYELIKNRPESIYYNLLKYLKENNTKFLENNDEQIIKSLKIILSKENYKNELKENYKILIPKLLKRINETKEYNKIYKEYLKNQLEELI